jgi:putative nucleotidyltransferase with HDIG domain
MRKILFVDDQPEVLRGLRRALAAIPHDWDIEFSKSGEEALDLMSIAPFDVVVSDMRMPKMNGVELLSTVMERYPDTVRIILSGYSDREMILNSLKCTHQFLAKPCDTEKIRYTIERTCRLRDLLRDKVLRKIATRIKGLHSLPTLYGMVVKEMQSPDVSLKKVGHIISQDTSMTAKVLQIVNSAYFGLPVKITAPQQAAIYLGLETLKALILSIHVFSSFTDDVKYFGQSLTQMWNHNMNVGRLAKEIAIFDKAEAKQAEEALVAGILHDIGKIILLQAPDQYTKVEDFINNAGSYTTDAEYAVLKTSHAELGAYLLGLWGLPDSIVETVAFHHNPSKLVEGTLVMENQSLNENADETKLYDSRLNSQTVKEYITEFNVLTYVHVANALLMQKDCSSDTTVFPYIDMAYLKELNLTDKLPEWVKYYNKIKQGEVKSE